MQLKSAGFSLNKINEYIAKNQKVNKEADSFSTGYTNSEYDEVEYSQFDDDKISSLESKIASLDGQVTEIQKKIEELNQEKERIKQEIEKYSSGNSNGNNSLLNYQRINEYNPSAVLQSRKDYCDSKIHEYLDEIGKIYGEREELVTELNKRKYLSLSKQLTEEEMEEIYKLSLYAPFLFDAEAMGFTTYNGRENVTNHDGYRSYDELIRAMESKGITITSIDDSLPDGEKIDWSKIESIFSKGINNLDLMIAFDLNGGDKILGLYNDTTLTEFVDRIEYYTDSEIAEAYNIYAEYGYDEFKEYIESKRAEINQREGMMKTLRFLSTIDLDDPNYQDYIKTHFKGLEDGLEQFEHGMEVFISPMGELSKDITADQYEAIFIATILGQSNANVDGVFKDWNALEKVYTLSMAEGNMLPSMAAGALGSVFGLEGLGAFAMFCSVTGTTAENTYQQGYDLYSSWVYGSLIGASEATLERVLGGIPGISKVTDKSFLVRIFSEGVEESLQEILDPFLKYAVTEEKPEINWDNVLQAGIDGMILAAYLNGGEIVIGSTTIGSETLDFLQNNYQHFKNNNTSGQEIAEILEYLSNGQLTIEQFNTMKELQSKGIEVDFNRITEEGYLESLQNGEVVKGEDHIKLLNMTTDQVRLSIQEEIKKLNPNSSDYNSKVEMLKLKEELEIDLVDKLSIQQENASAPTKSIDSLTLEQQQQVKTAASEVRSNAEIAEPKVTAIMESLVDSQTRLEGLDFKLKSENSIQDKIARKIDQGKTIDEAKNSIHDSIRYTLIVSGEYETTVLQKLSMLKDQGYEVVDMKNAWGGDIYQGLNVNLKNSDGLYVELQFHTEESFNVKEHLNHELYELSRNTTTSKEIREISDQIQALNQSIYVGSETTFSFTTPQELNTAVSNYYGDVEQRIIARMPKKASQIEQAKFVYNSLNELMEYSTTYYFGSKTEKNDIANQQIDINNIESNQIVCDTWAVMYSDFLNSIGISSKVMGKSHKWVVIEFDDGTKWVADPTQPYNGMTDLTNAKLGIESGGFFQVTDEMAESDTLLVGGYNFRNAKSMSNETYKNSDLMKKIDMKIGYDYDYISELFSVANTNSLELRIPVLGVDADATNGEIAAAKFEKIILPNMENLKGMESLSYYSAMKSILPKSESNLISYNFSPSDIGGYDIVFTIDLENGKIINYIFSPDGTYKKEVN